MAEPHLVFEVSDNVAHVTLNRPDKHNAASPEMIIRLAQVWDEIMNRAEIRVVVLTGAGDKAFSSGADLGSLVPLVTRARPPADEWDEKLLSDPGQINKALMRSVDMTTPVIAAVRGYAVAGGFELFLACDLRVVADNSSFGLTEVRRGLIPGGGGTLRLQRQIARALAAEILLVGDNITAQQAYRFGLVNRVVPSVEVGPTAVAIAERMAENAPLAMRNLKEVMLHTDGTPLVQGLRLEDDAVRAVMASDDAKEGAKAFIEKRAPRFTGH